MTTNHAAVTMIGLGPMGQAMTRTLLADGHQVTVWNRTRARADGVIADGAVWARDPGEAVRASPLIILSLTDYQAMYDVLGAASDELGGRTIINLSSESPRNTREAADWATAHGAEFIVGGVMVPPPMVGTDDASVFYSGPAGAFENVRAIVERIGAPHYLGADPALAQLMYQAHLDVFLTNLAGLAHATALLRRAGLPAAQVMPGLLEMIKSTPDIVLSGERLTLWEMIDSGSYPGDQANATMMSATVDHIVAASEEVGIDLALPRAIQAHYQAVLDAGHGADSWARIVESIDGSLRQP